MQRLISLVIVAATSTPLAGQAAPGEGAYVARAGASVIARESYRFDGRSLIADVALVSSGMRLSTETVVGAAGLVERFHLAARGASGEAVIQELNVTIANDTATWKVTGGAGGEGRTPLSRPYAVMQNLQFSHVALLLRHYDRARGGRQSVNAWLPQGGVSLPVTVTLSGDSGSIEVAGVAMQVRVDASGWLVKAVVPAQGVTVDWQPRLEPEHPPAQGGQADTSPPATVEESEQVVQSGVIGLSGTLTMPKHPAGRVVLAVIVAGSGPTDRNGNSVAGVRSNTYAQLAWRLAERGIATWRYDKRGLGLSSTGFDFAQTTFDDFAGDVTAAVHSLAPDPRFSRVVVLGHSEGAGLAVRAANQGAPVAGIALLAGMGRPFGAVLRGQLAAQFDAATMAQWDVAFAAYLRGDPVGELPTALQPLVAPVNRRFVQTSVAYDPVSEVRIVKVPVLIVQGSTDFQITEQDARALAASRPDARLVLLKDANHLFKRATSADRGSQAAQYLDPTVPIVPELVDAVAGWIAALK